MSHRLNPFHELYVTESYDSEAFVKLFSNILVNHTIALFKPGNVILKGLPGTGKTMILHLLKPGIRLAYKKCGIEFPIPKEFSSFIGAGINLIRCGAADFGQRPIVTPNSNSLTELGVFFGDFINYWIVRDILNSLIELGNELKDEIDIDLSPSKLESFVSLLKNDDAWFGYLNSVDSFEDLNSILKNRIVAYRAYLNYNSDSIPNNISKTKTTIGVPISATAKYLRQSGVISKNVHIYVRIDQHEELIWLDQSVPSLGTTFQSVIHKLLAMRDPNVSYRIGTRPFAWNDDSQTILGTSAQLEHYRNYTTVSIDEVLRRHENIKTYIFPKYAEDIFEKRLLQWEFKKKSKTKSLLSEVFGDGLDPREKAIKYVVNSKKRAVELDKDWPDEWKQFLLELAEKDPLSARLGEGWARQRGKGDIIYNVPTQSPYPWEEQVWWKKERIELALLQLASRNRQQLIWEGKDDILNLSGGNILVFLSLCQQIWEVAMRNNKNLESKSGVVPTMDYNSQTLGILEASLRWYEKLASVKDGSKRKLFVDFLGAKFHKKLTNDSKMSYPGHNGFSVENTELESDNEIFSLLKEASDFGDLFDRPHTTKSAKREVRTKWYLNSILSPKFKIPVIHTKEHMYISIQELRRWMIEANVIDSILPESLPKRKTKKKSSNDPNQGRLF